METDCWKLVLGGPVSLLKVFDSPQFNLQKKPKIWNIVFPFTYAYKDAGILNSFALASKSIDTIWLNLKATRPW